MQKIQQPMLVLFDPDRQEMNLHGFSSFGHRLRGSPAFQGHVRRDPVNRSRVGERCDGHRLRRRFFFGVRIAEFPDSQLAGGKRFSRTVDVNALGGPERGNGLAIALLEGGQVRTRRSQDLCGRPQIFRPIGNEGFIDGPPPSEALPRPCHGERFRQP